MSSPVVTRIQARFADFDPNGHVNNVAYFAFMEIGRVAFLRELRSVGRMTSTIIAHAEIDYLREIRMNAGAIDVTVSIAKVGRSSFSVLHEISDPHGVAARGLAILVAITPEGSSRPLTSEEREVLVGYLSSDTPDGGALTATSTEC